MDTPEPDATINLFESKRNKDKSIAINYNFETFGLTPMECLEKIELFKSFVTREKINFSKAQFILMANKSDKSSAFHTLPTDVVKNISFLTGEKSPCYQNNIFYQCPPEVKDHVKEHKENKSIKQKIKDKLQPKSSIKINKP